jgi:predicted cation transporter
MDGNILVNIGLFVIFLAVLIGPFRFRLVEQNLEIFLMACGVIALTISGFATIEGYTFGWTAGVVTEALTAPLLITTVFGIPVGIVQIVLLFGLFFLFQCGPEGNSLDHCPHHDTSIYFPDHCNPGPGLKPYLRYPCRFGAC